MPKAWTKKNLERLTFLSRYLETLAECRAVVVGDYVADGNALPKKLQTLVEAMDEELTAVMRTLSREREGLVPAPKPPPKPAKVTPFPPPKADA